MIALTMTWISALAVSSKSGPGHGEAEPASAQPSAASTIPVVTAERNIENESGSFNLMLKRSPADVRAGETEQFVLRITEKVEGGFSVGTAPVERAVIAAVIERPGGGKVDDADPVKAEADGNYRTSYTFGSSGDYKVVFTITTEDGRRVVADFPVAVASAPILWSFWIGVLVLIALTLAAVGAVFYSAKKRGGVDPRRMAPLLVSAGLLFLVGILMLIYFLPGREVRAAAELPLVTPADAAPNPLADAAPIIISKESQLLFGIKTETVTTRQITSGLKTSGVVKPLPNARAVVSTQVAGRIVLRDGLGLGSAVGKGERVGTVEQVLDVGTQSGLESQRLDIEARRLELRNTLLRLQAEMADQSAKAQQARTRLAQAQRELRRSVNLVEVGAVPKKRVEEAQTAVRVAEQEVSSAEQQVQLLGGQIRQTKAGQGTFNAVNRPSTSFPLLAPVTGIVSQISATSGQQLEAGKEILSIVNLSNVLIEANVFERDLPAVRESTRASFTSAALSGEVYTIGGADGDGRLVSIGQTVDEQTRTVAVIYEMKNPGGRLRDGMFVDITIDTSGDRQVLAVLKKSVVTEQGQTFVYVFNGGESFEKRPVSLGAEGSDYWEVRSGLKEGERVVTEGLYQLRSTQPTA